MSMHSILNSFRIVRYLPKSDHAKTVLPETMALAEALIAEKHYIAEVCRSDDETILDKSITFFNTIFSINLKTTEGVN